MNKVIKKYSGQHKSVMLEDIDSKLDLVLEQFSGMRGDIRKNTEDLAEFRKETEGNFKILFDFRSDMLEFKDDMLEFKDDMLEFKDDMLEFKDGNEKNMAVALEYLSGIDDEIASLKSEIKIAVDAEKRLTKVEKLVFAKLH